MEKQHSNNGPEGEAVGRVTVDITVTNYRDLHLNQAGMLAPEKVRRFQLQSIVGTGATHLVLPADAAERLGLPTVAEATIRFASGQSTTSPIVADAYVELQGRAGAFRAVLEPNRTTALIGAIVLEDLDFLVDCTNQRLVPRDPERIISEVG
jgi:predicted aspartyl protease